ncbi:MAG: phenylacetate--CoA ligase family protein [Candidatus Lokiarchaeia archaeon]
MSWIWRPELEFMPRDQLNSVQNEALVVQLHYVYNRSKLYRKKFDDAKVKPSDIKSSKDLVKLPLTTMEEMQTYVKDEKDPYAGRLCVPENQLHLIYEAQEIFAPEYPVFTGITTLDRENVLENFMRQFAMIGIRPYDFLQVISFSWEAFFCAYFRSSDKISPSISDLWKVRVFGLEMLPPEAPRTLATARLFKPSTIFANLAHMAQYAATCKTEKVTPESIAYDRVIIRENKLLNDKEKSNITEVWGSDVFNMLDFQENLFYAVDCEKHQGIHLWEDMYLVEAVDGDTGKPVGENESGRIAITNLFAQGMPTIRYLTNVEAKIDRMPCECGRTHARIKI